MKLKNFIEYFVFQIFVKFFNIWGIKSAPFWGKVLATMFYYVIPLRKKVVMKNLKIAFPDLSEDEIKKLTFKHYHSVSITLVEVMCLKYSKPEEIKNLIDIENLDIIKEKLKQNKGVIMFAAHLGNWEIGALGLAMHLNDTLHVLGKDQRNNLVNKFLIETREAFGNKNISAGVAVKNIFKSLKENKVIGVVGDQRGPREGMRVKLFGRDTSVYTGTAAITLKTGSPVIACMVTRQADNRYLMTVEDLEYQDIEGSKDERIHKFNQRYMNILEKTVTKYPEQWFWMHNIWKY